MPALKDKLDKAGNIKHDTAVQKVMAELSA